MAQSNETNPRLTENTCDEPEASLQPLEDYQYSELVSLEIATEPIQSLFGNLPRDVWIAKNASKKPTDNLTCDESAAIHLYTMEIKNQPLYSLLNTLLRDRDRRKLKPWFAYLKLFLTALFRLPPCPSKIVWRGVKKDLHSKYHRGEHYTWWAFSSCTLSLEALEQDMYLGTNGERTLFSIECLNGKNIKSHSYYKEEDEILLLPGFYFEVVSKVKAGSDLHIIHLREVVPPFVLLEPPFDIRPSASLSSIAPAIDVTLDKVYEMNKDNDNMFKLFVILPSLVYKWDSTNLFENTYVLHFVCECLTNEMHFACNPPYTVPNPRVFFQIYDQYMAQFMIPLARHLFDQQITDRYHDDQFWGIYRNNLDKIKGILDIIKHDAADVKKASHASRLGILIFSVWPWEYSLCRSLTTKMSIRWVCMKHYPIDQLNLIDELDDIQEINLDINRSLLRFTKKIDSAKISRICNVFARGLRLYEISLSRLITTTSALQQLTSTLSRASLMTICCNYYVSQKPSDDETSRMTTVLRACNEIVASNSQIKRLALVDGGERPPRNDGMVDALKTNRCLRHFEHALQINSTDIGQLMSIFDKSQILTTLVFNKHSLLLESARSIAALIRSSCTLVNLQLFDTDLTDEKMQILVDAICTNPIMSELDVSQNKLSDDSAPFIVRLVKVCSSLTNLRVSSNSITIVGAQLIFQELQTNRALLHFDVGFNNLSVNHARTTSKDNGSLIGIGELIARLLLKNTTLCALGIISVGMSDSDLRPISEALGENRTLASLRLGDHKFASTLHNPITDVLPWNCSLIELDLSFSRLDDRDLQKLYEILQKGSKLRFLNLSHCEMDTDKSFILTQALLNGCALTHLNLKSNKLTYVSAKAVADMLRGNTNLTHLNIGWNIIGDDGVNAIAGALSANCSLTYLDIDYNNITDVGAQCIVHALKSNDRLLHLSTTHGHKLSVSILTSLRSIRRNLHVT